MSSSQHPVAFRLERQVGGATKLLATVMGLPLIDGIFPAIVLAGAVDSVAGILQVGLLVFGGSATVAVILAEMDGTPREQAKSVLLVGVGIVALAAIEATFAPTIESALEMARFERFAALVIAAIAAKTASARIGEYLPGPSVIVGLGLVASLDPAGFELATVPDYGLVLRSVAAAGTGVAFALAVALAGPWLRGVVDIDRFRFGSSVALGMLALSVVNLAPGQAPLAVLVVTGLLAFAPGEVDADADADEDTDDSIGTDAETGSGDSDPADAPDAIDAVEGDASANAPPVDSQAVATDGSGEDDSEPDYPGHDGDEREPWL